MCVPRAMALDASWMRSAACIPKMWTPRISPLSGLYINCIGQTFQWTKTILLVLGKQRQIKTMRNQKQIARSSSLSCTNPWKRSIRKDHHGHLCKSLPFIFSKGFCVSLETSLSYTNLKALLFSFFSGLRLQDCKKIIKP